MKRILMLATIIWFAPFAAADEVEGLVKKRSPYGVGETLDRLEKVLKGKGITVALRWPHGDRAAGVGISMRPTEVMVFGNPKLGSHLMTSVQTAGIDLPMKALAWRDRDGQVWLGYNDPAYIAARHGIDDRPELLSKIAGALDKLTEAALARE